MNNFTRKNKDQLEMRDRYLKPLYEQIFSGAIEYLDDFDTNPCHRYLQLRGIDTIATHGTDKVITIDEKVDFHDSENFFIEDCRRGERGSFWKSQGQTFVYLFCVKRPVEVYKFKMPELKKHIRDNQRELAKHYRYNRDMNDKEKYDGWAIPIVELDGLWNRIL